MDVKLCLLVTNSVRILLQQISAIVPKALSLALILSAVNASFFNKTVFYDQQLLNYF